METLRPVETVKLFIVHDGKVLLLKRAGSEVENIRPDGIDLPGGEIEAGETAEEAAVREAGEEAGRRIAEEVGRASLHHVYDSTTPKPEAGIIVTRHFFAVEVGTDQVECNPDEHAGNGEWRPWYELDKYMNHPPHIEAYLAEGTQLTLERLAA